MTGAIQERMKAEYQSKSGHMMFNMNIWSTIYLLVAVFLTNEIWHFIEFVQQFPFILFNIFAFSVLSALGQVIVISFDLYYEFNLIFLSFNSDVYLSNCY